MLPIQAAKAPLPIALIGALLFSASGLDAMQGQGGLPATTGAGDRQAILKDLDLRDRPLKDVVEFIRNKSGVNIVMDDSIDSRVTLKLKNVPWRVALDLAAEKAECVVIAKGQNVLKVEKPPRVRFAFDQADITKVIDAISKISGANIITAPEVQGTITLRLKDVPWRDALEQIVKTLGYTVVEEDRDILRVVSPATLVDQLVQRTFQLHYVRPRSPFVPTISSEYVQGSIPLPSDKGNEDFTVLQALRRMLSSAGSLEYIDRQNVILVKDTKPIVDDMERIIQIVDVEPRQVFVDIKFVTVRNTDILEYGINIGDTGWVASMNLGAIPHRLPFTMGPGGWEDDLLPVDPGMAKGPFADPTLNTPGSTIVMPQTIFGAMDFTGVSAALRLLKKDDSSEIVQAPKIIALDHQEATIFVGDTVRYAQSRAEQGQAGGLTLVVEEAPGSPVQTGFQLMMIPHIVPGTDKVMLEVIPESESLTGTGGPPLAPSGFDVFTVGSGSGTGSIALPRISASTIATKMLIRSGQTAVIGGLTTDSNQKSVTKVPFLGDIPILGELFTYRNNSKTRSSLIVFITPEIIQTPEETERMIRRLLDERKQAIPDYAQIFLKGKAAEAESEKEQK